MTEKLVDDLGVFDKVVDYLLAGNTDQERAMVKSMAKQAHEKGVEMTISRCVLNVDTR